MVTKKRSQKTLDLRYQPPSRPQVWVRDLINKYASAEDNYYDQYLGKVSALISVDQQELNSVLGKLISDPELRQNIGKRARKWVEKKL